jgi:4-hydroxybenzoate polyprenyltransferase
MLISPLLQINGLSLQMTNLQFVLLMLASVFITAGGYAINDYFDRKIDTVNSPDDVVVGRSISLRNTMAIHLILTSVGIILGILVAYLVHFIYLSLFFILGSGILWFYSTTYKRQALIGNIIVAIITGMIPMLVWLFELPLIYRNLHEALLDQEINLYYIFKWVAGFSCFAFILTLIREIIKDAEDIKGDVSFGRKTIPALLGMRVAKIIIIALIAFTIFVLFMVCRIFLPDKYTLAYVSLFLILPLIYVAYLIIKADNAKKYHTASIIIKCIMIAGLLYVILANYLINHLK